MNANILERLIDDLPEQAVNVVRVAAGAFWTAVETGRGTGLATTYKPTGCHSKPGGQVVRNCGRLCALDAKELAQYALSDDTLEASIGLAALNAITEAPASIQDGRNAADVLAECGQNARVGIVGAFPFVPELRKQVAELKVFDLGGGPGTSPLEEMDDWLSGCAAVCLSSTTLINKTFDRLTQHSPHARIVLTGPGTPLHPLLFEGRVHALCGSIVQDADTLFRMLLEGGTFRQFKHCGAVRLVTIEAQDLNSLKRAP